MFGSAIICGKPPLAANCTQERFHGESTTIFLPENEASRVKQKLKFSGFSFVYRREIPTRLRHTMVISNIAHEVVNI